MSTERLSNVGYLGLIKEATPGTPLTPTDYIPLYDEKLSTDGNFVDIGPAYGAKFATWQTLPGQRSFKGSLTCIAEPNTAGRLFDHLMQKGAPSGGGPYTHPFTTGLTVPASYTYDVSLGNIVKRFWGVQASKISPDYNSNEMRFKVEVSALGSFEGREIASQSGSGPYTITLKDPNGIFDGNPTKGLVVGDLIRFYDTSAGTYIDATVASIPTALTFTTSTNPTAIASGDSVFLRPATTSFNNIQSFLWAKTRVCMGVDAATALSATHTPVEQGSGWEIMHNFNDDNGEDRSGSFGPASLARTTYDANVNIKKITDNSDDEVAFNAMSKQAIVFRHYAGASNEYELRVTFNHLKQAVPLGNLKVGDLVYADQKYHVQQDATDGQALDVKVLSALATL